MSEPMKPLRVYGENEIGKILERATELQRSEPGAGAGGGMTLRELEEIAVEAGIDVRHVRRAALEVDSTQQTNSVWRPILGEDVRVVRETTLPGEVPEDRFEDLVATIQTSVSHHGQPSLIGRTLTWQGGTADNMRTLRVVVSARDGSTQIRLEENLGQMAGGLFGGIVGGVGCGVGFGVGLPVALNVLGSAAFAVAAPTAAIGLTFMGVREIYRRVVGRRRKIVDTLFERLVQEAQTAIERTTLASQ